MVSREVDPMNPGKFHSADQFARWGREGISRLLSDKMGNNLSGEELREYQAKRLKEEVDRFDTKAFKEYLNNPEKLQSIKVQPGSITLNNAAKNAKMQMMQGGGMRSMYMGMMCMTPLLRQGLNGETVASLAGVMTVLAMGWLMSTPSKIKEAGQKSKIKSEQQDLKNLSKAKKFDEWADKLESDVANGKTSLRKEFLLNNYVKPLRAHYISKTDFRIGMTEEYVGIAGAAILVDANREMMKASSDEEREHISDVYDASIQQLKDFAAQDGITPEVSEQMIQRTYAKMFYGTTKENGESYSRGRETLNTDWRTVETSIPTSVRNSGQSRESVFVDFDGDEPVFKQVNEDGSVTDFEGEIHPAPPVSTKDGCDAIYDLMKDFSSHINDYKDIEVMEQGLYAATESCSRPGVYVPPENMSEPAYVKDLTDISNIFAQVVITQHENMRNLYGDEEAMERVVDSCMKPMMRQFIIGRDRAVLEKGISADEYNSVLEHSLDAIADVVESGGILADGTIVDKNKLFRDISEVQALLDYKLDVDHVSKDNIFNQDGLVTEEAIVPELARTQFDVGRVRHVVEHYPNASKSADLISEHDQVILHLSAVDFLARMGLSVQPDEFLGQSLNVKFTQYVCNQNPLYKGDVQSMLDNSKSFSDIVYDTRAMVSEPDVYIEGFSRYNDSASVNQYTSRISFGDETFVIPTMSVDILSETYDTLFEGDWDWYDLDRVHGYDDSNNYQTSSSYTCYKETVKQNVLELGSDDYEYGA